MIALPTRATSAPLLTHSVRAGNLDAATLEDHIDATVDSAVAEALKKVSTPADDELAKQQAAFDRLMQARAEQMREANAIRDFGMEQMKKENAYMEDWIKMI